MDLQMTREQFIKYLVRVGKTTEEATDLANQIEVQVAAQTSAP